MTRRALAACIGAGLLTWVACGAALYVLARAIERVPE